MSRGGKKVWLLYWEISKIESKKFKCNFQQRDGKTKAIGKTEKKSSLKHSKVAFPAWIDYFFLASPWTRISFTKGKKERRGKNMLRLFLCVLIVTWTKKKEKKEWKKLAFKRRTTRSRKTTTDLHSRERLMYVHTLKIHSENKKKTFFFVFKIIHVRGFLSSLNNTQRMEAYTHEPLSRKKNCFFERRKDTQTYCDSRNWYHIFFAI